MQRGVGADSNQVRGLLVMVVVVVVMVMVIVVAMTLVRACGNSQGDNKNQHPGRCRAVSARMHGVVGGDRRTIQRAASAGWAQRARAATNHQSTLPRSQRLGVRPSCVCAPPRHANGKAVASAKFCQTAVRCCRAPHPGCGASGSRNGAIICIWLLRALARWAAPACTLPPSPTPHAGPWMSGDGGARGMLEALRGSHQPE